MITGKEMRDWTRAIQSDDEVDIIGGNTLTLIRNGKIIDCMPINSFSLGKFRKTIEKEKADNSPEGLIANLLDEE